LFAAIGSFLALADGHVAWCNLRGALAFRFGAQPLGPFSARWRS
jgi:hypothetical protein